MNIDIRPAHGNEARLLWLVASESRACTEPLEPGSDDSTVLRVALVAGQVAGFHAYRTCRGESELTALFVFAGWRSLGVGRALFDDLCAAAARGGSTRVRVVAHPWAEGYFRRVGARRVGGAVPCGPITWHRPVFDVKVQSVSRSALTGAS